MIQTHLLTDIDFFKQILNKNDLVAAPMAGITNPPFRKLVRKFFDGIMYSEMISVEGLKRKIPKTLKYLQITDTDSPMIFQLFGSNPNSYYDAVQVCEEFSKPDGYDVNMGCPVKKVLKSGSGSALLKDLKSIDNITRVLRKSTNKPISIKIRLGWDLENLVFRDIIRICENNGINAIAIHARTKTEMFSGEIHYDLLEEACQLTNIPIIGNGNVKNKESYERMKSTGVDGIMIGRAMMKSPWIFKCIKNGISPEKFLNKEELKKLLYEISDYEKEYRGEAYYLEVVRKYVVMFSKGIKASSTFRKEVYQTETEEELKVLINKFFDNII
jgi:nifR3 family TIM-barrel protein